MLQRDIPVRCVQAWEDCRTGYPWIDAIMRQLHEWGWMHHLARHCVVRINLLGCLCSWLYVHLKLLVSLC